MTTMNCATGTIAPYVPSAEVPWNKQRVLHLYRRMGFGARPDQIDAALNLNPSDLVDALVDEAINLPLSPEPEWAYWTELDYDDFFAQREEQYITWILQWMDDMSNNGFRDKLALFWHNHFVTRFEAYECTSYMYQYHKILQQYALGNFKEFVYEVGKTPAMLLFLNGVQNSNISPNENYARELYELFTLGQDNNYTQTDIEETARALTGFVGVFTFCGPIGFLEEYFDDGEKTIFGQTGNWNYDDVHDILFDQRTDEIATFICSKLYAYFVHPDVDEDIVSDLAATFKDNDFELAPVLRQLFKSEHFFDEYVIGSQVKSPIEHALSIVNDADLTYTVENLQVMTYLSIVLGQQLFNPVDVAGWQGNRSWINSNTLTGRWQAMDYTIFNAYNDIPERLVELAKKLSDDSNDPAYVAQVIVDHFTPNGLNTPDAYDRATTVLKWEVPQNYYDNGLWNLDWDTASAQVALLLQYIVRLPEFQLY